MGKKVRGWPREDSEGKYGKGMAGKEAKVRKRRGRYER